MCISIIVSTSRKTVNFLCQNIEKVSLSDERSAPTEEIVCFGLDADCLPPTYDIALTKNICIDWNYEQHRL